MDWQGSEEKHMWLARPSGSLRLYGEVSRCRQAKQASFMSEIAMKYGADPGSREENGS